VVEQCGTVTSPEEFLSICVFSYYTFKKKSFRKKSKKLEGLPSNSE
jgi:hypothetical protein